MSRMIRYEIKNTFGNIFGVIFGLIFPIFMALILKQAVLSEVPEIARDAVVVELFVANSLMIPLALGFVGFAALFSQEIEQDVITRMTLFGISENKQMQAKFIAQAITVLLSVTLYVLVVGSAYQVPMPSAYGVMVYGVSLLLITFLFFTLAYAIAITARKFSITYGVTMSLYFLTMIVSGMMGLRMSQLPAVIRSVSQIFFPTVYMVDLIPKLWTLNSYNIMPMVQAFLCLGAVVGIVYIIAVRRKMRRIDG